jgi:hypothetical protein
MLAPKRVLQGAPKALKTRVQMRHAFAAFGGHRLRISQAAGQHVDRISQRLLRGRPLGSHWPAKRPRQPFVLTVQKALTLLAEGAAIILYASIVDSKEPPRFLLSTIFPDWST